MTRLWKAIRSLLAKPFRGADEDRRLQTLEGMEASFSTSKRDQVDSVESLKEEIRVLETLARRKKQEFEKAHGDTKRIVAGEIERTFRALDRLRGRETILAASLDRMDLALAKIGEAKAALQAGVSEDQFDQLAVELQDLFTRLRESDKAARDLERESYVEPPSAQVETEQRLAELLDETKAPVTLSPQSAERLRELEAEEA